MLGNTKVVILGEAKSGTSGLFFKLKNSIQKNTRCLFEPENYLYVPEPGDDRIPVLAKILFGNPSVFDYSSFACFDKKIFIVRDPRDRIISEMLFWVNESGFWQNERKLNTYMDLLQGKEVDPGSISVIDLIRTARSLDNPGFNWGSWTQRIEERFVWMFGFLDNNPDYYLLKYEDFVSDRLARLENYLGFPVRGEAEVAGWAEIVARTKGFGDWKNWFTPEDINYFKPILTKPIQRFGYSEDWDTNAIPIIKSEYCTKYVEKTINKKKGLLW